MRRNLLRKITAPILALLLRALTLALPLTLAVFTSLAQSGPGGVGTSSDNVLWLRSTQGTSTTTNNNPVSAWNDISGNANHSEQATGSLQPLFITSGINGLPTIRFDGTDDFLMVPDADNLDNTSGLSVFVVAQPITPDSQPRGLVSKRVDSGSERAYSFFTYSSSNLYFDAGSDRFNGSDAVTDQPQILSAVFNGADANPRSRIFYNGLQSGTGNGPTSIGNMASNLHIGILNEGYAQGFQGDISEVIVYRKALNAAERVVVENYLSSRYDITLGDNYYTNTTYNHDVVGIGTTDGTIKQSETTSSGGGILLRELANSLDNTNEFVFAGHDGTVPAEVATDLPTLVDGSLTGRSQRVWYVQKTTTDAIDASIGFELSETDLGEGEENQIFYLLFRSGTSGAFSTVSDAQGVLVNGEVWFSVKNADLVNGYYTIARSDKKGKTWYSYKSGPWDEPLTWTLDASGDLVNDESLTPTTSPTAFSDRVVIKSPFVVTVTDNGIQNALLDVWSGGTVDFGTTTGHIFDAIIGDGTIKLSADNFPDGDASGFADASLGGTVEYSGATSYELSTPRTFRNMTINMDNPAHGVTLLANYTLNGSLTVSRGEFYFGDGLAEIDRTLTIYENLEVSTDGTIKTGNANARHQLNLYGDFTNQGEVEFTNRVAANYTAEATDGIVDVNFLSATRNQHLMLDGPSRFYRIKIDKGSTSTYELYIEATDPSYFNLFGFANQYHSDIAQLVSNTNAFALLTGTVRVGANISVPHLNGSGNYNISENAILWVDGGEVTKPSGTAVVVYGKVKVSDGVFNAQINSGITTRLNGVLEVSGGTANLGQFRTSVYGTQHIGGFIQTGGTVNINQAWGSSGNYYLFSLSYEGNVFTLTGGTLNIRGTNARGSIFINSDPVNQNVSANATLNLTSYTTGLSRITSRAPLPTVNLLREGTGSRTFVLEGGITGTTAANQAVLPALPLVTKGTLTIDDNVTFNPKGQNVTIGGGYSIGSGSTYQAASNTTTFAGATSSYDIEIDAAATTKYFHNLTINNPGQTGTLSGSDITIHNNLTITAGTLAGADRDITVRGNITNSGTITNTIGNVILKERGIVSAISVGFSTNFTDIPTITIADPPPSDPPGITATAVPLFNGTPTEANPLPLAGILVTNSGSGYTAAPSVSIAGGGGTASTTVTINTQHAIGGNGNGVFGNLEIDEVHPDESGGKVEVTYLTAQQTITGTLTLTNGILDIKTKHLVLDGSFGSETITDYSTTTMIRTTGNHSDYGVSRKISANGIYIYPLGVYTVTGDGNRYTPVSQDFTLFSDEGYSQVNNVDYELPTLAPSAQSALQYYWRVRHYDFSTVPRVYNIFYFYNTPATYYPGAANPSSWRTGKIVGYNRYYNLGPLNWNNGTKNLSLEYSYQDGGLTGNTPPELQEGEFTTGHNTRFAGTVRVFYLRANGNWRNGNTWSFTRGGGAAGDYPQAGDIAVIRRLSDSYSGLVEITNAETCAKVIFDDENGWSSGCPRLWFSNAASFNSNFVVVEVADTHEGGLNGINDGERHGAVIKYDLFEGYAGEFPSGDFGDFNQYPNALVIYAKEGATATVTLSSAATEYPQVWFDPPNNRTFILPDTHVTFNGMVIMPYGQTLRMNSGANGKATFKKRLNIGHSFGAGYFELAGNASADQTIIAETNINLYNNGQLRINSAAGGGRTHLIKLQENITMETGCSINLGDGDPANTNVTLELTGEGTNTLTGAGTASVSLSRVNMNKGSSQDQSFSFDWPFTLNGSTDGTTEEKSLQLQNGTLYLNHPDIDIDLSTGGGDFYIPSTSGLVVQQGEVNVSGDDSGILLDGLLRVETGGVIDMDDAVGNGNNYIEYSSSGNAAIEVTGGALTVGSQIRRGTSNPSGILRYEQTGGTVIVGKNAAPVGNRGTLEVLNSGSSFDYTGGTLTVVRSQAGATVPSVILEPGVGSADESTLQLGNADTPASSVISIKSALDLGNLTVSGSSTTAQLKDRSLVVKGNLTIAENCAFTGFDGDYRSLTVNRNIYNNGEANFNVDSLILRGIGTSPSAAMQEIHGGVIVNNLVVEPENSVTLQPSSPIEVKGNLYLNSGQLVDGGNTITVKGNVSNVASHASTNPSMGGLLFSGTNLQTISGTGQFGNIVIDKSAEEVRLLNSITLNRNLTLTNGILNIQNHRLALGNDAYVNGTSFGTTKMIKSDGGFGDLGISKSVVTGAQSFTLPIGVGSGTGAKYTPVVFDITANSSAGTISVHPINQAHMTAECDDVLQYYWNMTSSGISGFEATVNFHFHPDDVVGTLADFYRARLEGDSWTKIAPDPADNELVDHNRIEFTYGGVSNLNGDYTAGTDACIPNNVPVYYTVSSGSWSDKTIWQREGGGTVPDGGPQGHIVRISSGHTVAMDRFRIRSYRTIITGRLEVGTQVGHHLGFVSGTGTLAMVNEKLYPGDYTEFLACGTGGTMEFGGAGSYPLPNILTYNNLTIAGTGTKTSVNDAAFTVCGKLLIKSGASFRQFKNASYKGNIEMESGGNFSTVGWWTYFNGSNPQLITGDFTGSRSFKSIQFKNVTGYDMANDIEVSNNIQLVTGRIRNLGSTFSYMSTAGMSPTYEKGGNAEMYIEGNYRRLLPSSTSTTFYYPVGKPGKKKLTAIVNPSTSGNQLWSIEYFDTHLGAGYYDAANYDAPLETISQSEYWTLNGPSGGSAFVEFTLTGTSDVAAALGWAGRTNLRIVRWNSSNSKWEIVGDTPLISGSAIDNATIRTGSAISFDGTNQYFTLASDVLITIPTATFTSVDHSICEGGTTSLFVALSGDGPWEIKYTNGTTGSDWIAVSTSPYEIEILSSTTTTTYTLTGVRTVVSPGVYTEGNIFGDPVTVSVYPTPTPYTVTGGGEICGAGTGTIGLEGSDMGVTYELWFIDEGRTVQTQSGTGDAIAFTNIDEVGTYEVRAYNTSHPACAAVMNGTAEISLCVGVFAEITNLVTDATICEGQEVTLEITFSGTPPFTFTVENNYGESWIRSTDGTLEGTGPYTFSFTIPDPPVWNAPDLPNVFTYTITSITDNNSVVGNIVGAGQSVNVWKIPKTGPQYHIPNTFGQ